MSHPLTKEMPQESQTPASAMTSIREALEPLLVHQICGLRGYQVNDVVQPMLPPSQARGLLG